MVPGVAWNFDFRDKGHTHKYFNLKQLKIIKTNAAKDIKKSTEIRSLKMTWEAFLFYFKMSCPKSSDSSLSLSSVSDVFYPIYPLLKFYYLNHYFDLLGLCLKGKYLL